MPDQTYMLGIDVGTTGCKILLINAAGAVVGEETRPYQLSMPHPLWSEQDPDDWWEAATAGVTIVLAAAGVPAGQVAAVGLTGQMHGLVLLDAQGKILRPCILWNDQRTAKQCATITETVGAQRVLELTGNPVLTGFTAPKLVWVREHEPETYARIAHVLLPKDYVRYRLTGELLGDVSDASGTALFDVGRRCWSEEMLATLDIPRAWLPETTESAVVSAKVDARGARESGLPIGTPVVGGAGDQAAQAVGSGIISEGLISTTLGTSGVVFAASDSYRVEPEGRLHAFCHAVPGMWHLMGVMLSAGGSFEWFYDTVGGAVYDKHLAECEQAFKRGEVPEPKTEAQVLLELAAEVPPGAEGLLFLPYLTGERTPHADPHARGAFVGLTTRHDLGHLTRAVLEGVSFGLRDSLELMRGLGIRSEQVRVSGGGARSALWRQILADVFNTEIVTLNVTQGAAYGAALLAGVGVGIYSDVTAACEQVIKLTGRTDPSDATKVYAAYYPRYRALYPALAAEFSAITDVVSKTRSAWPNPK